MYLDDLIGLNGTDVHDMPLIGDFEDANALLRAAQTGQPHAGQALAPAGMRHCQGGHSALGGARVLLTEALHKVTYNPIDKTFTADAGATWAQIHHTLLRHGLAPLVQQASGHFTVGGSLGANCHGRDPSQGPLADTVVSIKVLCGDGRELVATPHNEYADLFAAVIGGYGACGLILEATFRTTRNLKLAEYWYSYGADEYQKKVLQKLPQHGGGPSKAHLHYGWLCCLSGPDFLNEVVYADYVEENPEPYNPAFEESNDFSLKDEAWGTSELLRASWAAASESENEKFQSMLWKEIKALKQSNVRISQRLNWMRAAVSFTVSRGNPERHPPAAPDRVAMLQEYFVPLDKFQPMLATMREAFAPGNAAGVRLLTCTVRWVQKQQVNTALNYAPEGRVCLALEAMVPLEGQGIQRAPQAPAKALFQTLIRRAIALDGTYYLPYYPFAEVADFQNTYGAGATILKDARQKYDPNGRFDNVFLNTYLA